MTTASSNTINLPTEFRDSELDCRYKSTHKVYWFSFLKQKIGVMEKKMKNQRAFCFVSIYFLLLKLSSIPFICIVVEHGLYPSADAKRSFLIGPLPNLHVLMWRKICKLWPQNCQKAPTVDKKEYPSSDLGSLRPNLHLVAAHKVLSQSQPSLSFRQPKPYSFIIININDLIFINCAPKIMENDQTDTSYRKKREIFKKQKVTVCLLL